MGCSKDFQCIIFPAKGRGKACRDKQPTGTPFDWTGWGKGAANAWMGAAAMGALAHQFGAQAMGFSPPFGYPMPCPGMEMFEENEDWTWPKGKGKGKKGKHRKGWYSDPEADEFEKKVAHLLELQLANEEVIRELLVTHEGDLSQVVRVLTT